MSGVASPPHRPRCPRRGGSASCTELTGGPDFQPRSLVLGGPVPAGSRHPREALRDAAMAGTPTHIEGARDLRQPAPGPGCRAGPVLGAQALHPS